MDFQTAVRSCLTQYATFEGRAGRAEFWWFALFVFLGRLILGLVDSFIFATGIGMMPMAFSGHTPGLGGGMMGGWGMGFWGMGAWAMMASGPLAALFGLAVLLPSIAVGVRRLHDVGRSGWWLLIWLVPVVGWLVLLFWFVQPSQATAAPKPDAGANQ